MEDDSDFNKSDEDNLASFIRNKREVNTALAYEEAKRIHNQIDFKSHIGAAVSISENSAEIIFEDEKLKNQNMELIFAGEENWHSVFNKLCEIVQQQGISCSLVKTSYILYDDYCWHNVFPRKDFDDDALLGRFRTNVPQVDSDGEIFCSSCGTHLPASEFNSYYLSCLGLVISWPSADEPVSA